MKENKRSLSRTHPVLARQWHPTKNGKLTPREVIAGSNKKVWWQCSKGDDHEWQATVSNRSKGSGCPVCAGQKAVRSNCLATTHPKLAKQWHPTKNQPLTPYDVKAGSNKKVWWKSLNGDDDVWQSRIVDRTKRVGSSGFSRRAVVKSNCLATTHPQLAKQWHPTKNQPLTAYDVKAGSNKKVWWKCDKG